MRFQDKWIIFDCSNEGQPLKVPSNSPHVVIAARASYTSLKPNQNNVRGPNSAASVPQFWPASFRRSYFFVILWPYREFPRARDAPLGILGRGFSTRHLLEWPAMPEGVFAPSKIIRGGRGCAGRCRRPRRTRRRQGRRRGAERHGRAAASGRPGLRGTPICYHSAGVTGPSGADALLEEAAA